MSKLTLATPEATLMIYRKPEHLLRDIPAAAAHARAGGYRSARAAPAAAPRQRARRGLARGGRGGVESGRLRLLVRRCHSERGARGRHAASKSGAAPGALADRLRALPVPIIGLIADNSLLLDLRCLEEKDEAEFDRQIDPFSDTP